MLDQRWGVYARGTWQWGAHAAQELDHLVYQRRFSMHPTTRVAVGALVICGCTSPRSTPDSTRERVPGLDDPAQGSDAETVLIDVAPAVDPITGFCRRAARLGIGAMAAVALWSCSSGGGDGGDGDYDSFTDAGGQGFLNVTPRSLVSGSGPEGGPFTPSTTTLRISNEDDQPMNWRASSTAPWLLLSTTFGKLAPGESQEIVLEFDLVDPGTALDLVTGDYTCQVLFVNMSDGGGEVAIPVHLRVGAGSADTGTTYYVDYASGSDANDGLSQSTAWKHSPGDANATANAAATAATIAPGDRVIFKGGVHYRGSIVAQASGAAGAPIVYDGNSRGTFGTGKAIIDGSTIIKKWTQIEANRYTAILPAGVDAFNCNLFAGERRLTLAQGPTPTSPLHFDDLEEFRSVAVNNLTTSSVTDPDFFATLPGNFWQGGYIAIWAPSNRVYFQSLTGFNANSSTLSFEPISSIYTDRDSFYAILNSDGVLDQPGEYVMDEAIGSVVLWPRDSTNVQANRVTVSVREFGFDLAGHSYLNIEGFRIIKHSAGLNRYSLGVGIRNTSKPVDGVVIRNNVVSFNRSMASGGAITLNVATDSTVDGNFIYRNLKSRGTVFAQGCTNLTVTNNCLFANGGTGLTLFTCLDSLIEHNSVLNHRGVHGNGITLYKYSSNCLVRKNLVLGGNIALTTGDSTDLVIAYNIFAVADGKYVKTVADWGASSGLRYYNNVIVSEIAAGLYVNENSETGAEIKNNILDGALFTLGAVDNSHNIYTSLSWSQDENNLDSTEMYITDKSKIFADFQTMEFLLMSGSPAIDAGIDVGLDETIYGSGVDMGAKEFRQ